VYIGRPGEWGNPYSHLGGVSPKWRCKSREEAVSKYRAWLMARMQKKPDLIWRMRDELQGKTLGCWCKPLACHGDVIVEILESE
jgi:hypothetical protein